MGTKSSSVLSPILIPEHQLLYHRPFKHQNQETSDNVVLLTEGQMMLQFFNLPG